MNNRFDELAKSMAQSVSRRAALKKFGVGLAGMALACFGLAGRAEAQGNCWQTGVLCDTGFLPKACRKCCHGFHCIVSLEHGRRCYCD